MKILNTQIPLIEVENIDKAKVHLADNIIKRVGPLFNDIYAEQASELNDKKKKLDELKTKVIDNKNKLQEKINYFNKQKNLKNLLDRIEKLIRSGLVYDGKLKSDTIILLKVLDKLSEEKIDFHKKEIMTVISKRFAKQ